jgi:hypothetical protein
MDVRKRRQEVIWVKALNGLVRSDEQLLCQVAGLEIMASGLALGSIV